MAGEDANVELALARSLVDRMDEGDARRHWSKTVNPREFEPIRTPDDTSADNQGWLWLEQVTPVAAVPVSREPRRHREPALTGAGTSTDRGAGLLF
jgi:hypothetical protein